jgi:hypothetical protein
LYDELLDAMREWAGWWSSEEQNQPTRGARPCQQERPNVNSTSYMVLRSPAEFLKQNSRKSKAAAAKLLRHSRLWSLAAAVIQEIDPDFAGKYTANAFTQNFVGSPHIDTQDIGPQYCLGLGEYSGGELCIESGSCEVSRINTRGALVKVDGRYPHWVAPFEGERFSVVWYQTTGERSPRGRAVPVA